MSINLNGPEGDKVRDLYGKDEFEGLLSRANSNAETDWEVTFVDDMIDRYKEYGPNMILSYRQRDKLEGIADGTDDYGDW